MASSKTVVLASKDLGKQSWWHTLHSMINLSYQNKNIAVFPPSWTRLHSDATIGAQRLAQELGPFGCLIVILEDREPIACGGAEPFRGANWINDILSADEEVSNKLLGLEPVEESTAGATSESETRISPPSQSSPIEEWEICCFCVHPQYRHRKLGTKIIDALTETVRPLGGQRLFSNYVIEETGKYWPKMGFDTIPGAGGMLRKGFTHTLGMEGLRADIHFAMGVKDIRASEP